MNNNGAIYVWHADHAVVADALAGWLSQAGYRPSGHTREAMSGRIMAANKPWRLFFVLPARDGWVTIWEDPRYFGERALAQYLARTLAARAIWIEVSGNGVGWARGVYQGETVEQERYEEQETTFYGEYGSIFFAFDSETMPEDFIAEHTLPYAELHYEAVLDGELPASAGEPIFLAFERVRPL
jgi:hypothetical protein